MLRLSFFLAMLVLSPVSARAAVFYPTDFTLANGLEIVVVPNHLAPVVTQMVWYKVGSADETPGQTGLAHYLEHLMFRGTSKIGPGEFSKVIAAQGGEDNAFTSYDYTAFHETVAADRLPMIMQMEADRMQNLRITPETAVPELSVVLNERQERTDNNPEGRFEEKLRSQLMPNYPYGTPVIGWKREIEKLTAENATKFYQAHYAPNNAIVIISGDVLPEKVMRLASAIYGPIPRRHVALRKTFPELSLPKQQFFSMMDVGIEQPQLIYSTVMPSYSTQKGREAYACEVLAEALDGGEVGSLYKKLVVEDKLASGVGTAYDPDARGNATFSITLSPHPGVKTQKLEEALQEELHALAQAGLEPQDIESAKQRLQRAAIFARDSLLVPGYSFGMALTTGHSVADVEDWPERIDAVTADEVNTALRSLVDNPHHIAAMLLPDPKASRVAREAARPLAPHEMGIK